MDWDIAYQVTGDRHHIEHNRVRNGIDRCHFLNGGMSGKASNSTSHWQSTKIWPKAVTNIY